MAPLVLLLWLPLVGSPADEAAPAPAAAHCMMMAQHGDIAKLVSRLENSFAILENEKDPALLKKELVEHGALLKDLESKVGGEKNEMCKGMKGNGAAEEQKAAADPHAEHHH